MKTLKMFIKKFFSKKYDTKVYLNIDKVGKFCDTSIYELFNTFSTKNNSELYQLQNFYVKGFYILPFSKILIINLYNSKYLKN